MLEHTSYFLQTFGKEPQGESFDNAILNDTDPTKTMFYTSELKYSSVNTRNIRKIYIALPRNIRKIYIA